MWARTIKGLVLTFHLAGINNQNFLMRDDQTGTFWQQISGRAISGPLADSQLTLVHSDELTFALWKKESPSGFVLKSQPADSADYETKDWDVSMAKARTVLDFPNSGLQSRDLILGITAFGASRAYLVSRILEAKLLEDRLGAQQIIIVVGPDGKSIRVFQAGGDFYRMKDSLMDAHTGSMWGFDGCVVSGRRAGECLKPVDALKDYWFDWRNYHPDTTIFQR